MSVHNISSLIDIFNKFFQSFLGYQNPICFEQTENVQTVSIMPHDILEIAASSLKVLVEIFACYYTKKSSVIIEMSFEDVIQLLCFGFG